MKQRLTILATLLCCAVVMMAETVSPDAARQAAMDFLKKQGATLRSEAARAKSQTMANEDGQQVEASPYYVFNASQGFVVVSGDDCVGDNLVLGYAPRGSFCEKNVPEGLRWWLKQTARQIGELSRLGIRVAATPLHDDIAPMTTSLWDQDWPYYNACPEFEGDLSYTGCMSTALAQVMRYHRWPQGPTACTMPAYTMTDGTPIEAIPAGLLF